MPERDDKLTVRLVTKPLAYMGGAIQALLVSKALHDSALYTKAIAALTFGLGQVLQISNTMGRAMVLVEAEEAKGQGGGPPSSLPPSPPAIVGSPTEAPPAPPKLPPKFAPGKPPVFTEMLEDIASRVPVVIRDPLKRTAEEVGRLYQESHVFALAKSADAATTERVQSLIEKAVREGTPIPRTVDAIVAETSDWTRAYAETVVRTNMKSAATEGRLQQLARPETRLVFPTLIFRAVKDARTRPNHALADGASAPVDHPLIMRLRTPLGYNCRCRWRGVTWAEARRLGLVDGSGAIIVRLPPAGAGPDPGFVHVGIRGGVV